MKLQLPPPAELGLPLRFDKWRPTQEQAIWRGALSKKRFIGDSIPTGLGKSIRGVAQALLERAKGFFLTANNGLLGQYTGDFESTGLIDIKGKGNYPCHLEDDAVQVDEGICTMGEPCELKESGCAYYDRRRQVWKTQLVATNYDKWLSEAVYGDSLGACDILFLDEADAAHDKLCEAVAVRLGRHEVKEEGMGSPPEEQTRWREWALRAAHKAERRFRDLKEHRWGNRANWLRMLRHYRGLGQRMRKVASAQGRWVLEVTDHGFLFTPVWGAAYAERYLFQGAPKVVLYSATLVPKTLELLGIPEEKYEYTEYPSTFPVASRTVTWVRSDPEVRINARAGPDDYRRWAAKNDAVLDTRLDRKGIIHVGSYKRAEIYMELSRHRRYLRTHDKAGVGLAVEQYKSSGVPIGLVSPVLKSGYNFPYRECEYNIIAKVPFPDRSSPLLIAREEDDRDYGAYVAAHDTMQIAGRGNRAQDDFCETLITDDSWGWFKSRYQHFFHGWFRQAWRTADGFVPKAPPPIGSKR